MNVEVLVVVDVWLMLCSWCPAATVVLLIHSCACGSVSVPIGFDDQGQRCKNSTSSVSAARAPERSCERHAIRKHAEVSGWFLKCCMQRVVVAGSGVAWRGVALRGMFPTPNK